MLASSRQRQGRGFRGDDIGFEVLRPRRCRGARSRERYRTAPQPGPDARLAITESTTDRIEKDLVLRAPRARVWRALTDVAAFGNWFGVRLEGAFVPGERLRGQIADPE